MITSRTTRSALVDDSNDYISTASEKSMGDYSDIYDSYDDNYDDNRVPMAGRTDECCSLGSDVSAANGGSHSDKGSFTNLPMKTARSTSSSQSPLNQDEEWTSQSLQISDASRGENQKRHVVKNVNDEHLKDAEGCMSYSDHDFSHDSVNQLDISSIDDNTEQTCDADHTSLVDSEGNSNDLLVGFGERPLRHLNETSCEPLSYTHIHMESEDRSGDDLSYEAELDLDNKNGSVQQYQNHEEDEECDDCSINESMCKDGEGSSLPVPQEYVYRLPQLQAAMIELSKQTVLPKETRAVLKVRIEEAASVEPSKTKEEGRVPFSRPTIGNFCRQSERVLVDDEDSYNGEEDDKLSSNKFTPAVPSYVTKVEGEDSLLDAIKHSTARSQIGSGVESTEDFDMASGPLNSRSQRAKTTPSNDQDISTNPSLIAAVVEQDSIEDFTLDGALKPRNRKLKAQPSTVLASSIATLPSFGAGTAYRSRKASTKNRLRQYGSGGRFSSRDTSNTGVRGSSGALDRTSHSAAPVYQQSMSGALDSTSHSAAPRYQQSMSGALNRTSHSAAPEYQQSMNGALDRTSHSAAPGYQQSMSGALDRTSHSAAPGYQQPTFLQQRKVRRSTMSHAKDESSLHEQPQISRRSTMPHVSDNHNFREAESVGTNSLVVGRVRRESIALRQQHEVTVRNAIPSATKSHNFDDTESVGGYSLDTGRGRRGQENARRSNISHTGKNHEFDDAESVGGYSFDAGGRIHPTSLHQQQHTTRRSTLSHTAKIQNVDDTESVGRYSLQNGRGRSQSISLQNQQSHARRSTMPRTTKSHYADYAVSIGDGDLSTSFHTAPINQHNKMRRGNSVAETPNTDYGGHVPHHDVYSNLESRRPQRRSTLDHASSFVSGNRQRKSSQTSTLSYKSVDDFSHEKERTNRVESYSLNSAKYRNEASSQIITSTQGMMDHNTRRMSQSIAENSNIPAANDVDEDDDDDDAASVDSMVMFIAIKGKTIALKNASNRVKGSTLSVLREQKKEMKKHAAKERDREIGRGLRSSGGTVLSEGGTTKYGPTPSRNSMASLPIDVECWLEHCREPIALQKVKKKRNSTGARIGAREYSMYNRTLNSLVDLEFRQMDLERAVIKAGLKKRIDLNKDSLSDMAKSSKLMKSMYHDFERQSGFMANLGKGKQVRRSSLENTIDLTMHSQDKILPSHRTFPKSIFRVVCLLPGNEQCCDCSTKFRDMSTLWASVTYGILLCEQCAFHHVNKYGEVRLSAVSIYLFTTQVFLITRLLSAVRRQGSPQGDNKRRLGFSINARNGRGGE